MLKLRLCKYLIIVICALFTVGDGFAQEKAPFFDRPKKNVFKWNYSSYILFGDPVFNYERMINSKQSLSIGAGYRNFPNLIKERDNDIFVLNQEKKGGFSLSAEYRFYLQQRNKRKAPDGVYIGPYISYYKSGFKNNMEIKSNDVIENIFELDTDIKVFGVGFELGYHFIFKNFISLDVIVFGPSWSWYNAQMNIIGNLDANEENEAYQAMREFVIDKYPQLENVLDDVTISSKGKLDTWTLGFRYVLQIGIAF